MSALILEEPGCLRLADVALPTTGAGELLIKIEAATTCGTDLKAFLRGHPQIPMPGVFGHEYSGIVVAAGAGAKFRVGQPVMGVHSAPCQSCTWCLRNQENLCESVMTTKVLGSFAEYLLIPKRIADLNVFEKPDSLSFSSASLLEPLACVAQGIELLSAASEDRVLVIGPGAIGLMFVAALRALGVGEVALAGRNPVRLKVGELLGARPIELDSVEESGTYDVVIECTGSVDVWERSLQSVRRGGKLMLFGGCPTGTTAAFDTRKLHYDQISVLSPFHFGTRAVRTAREWLVERRLDLSPLISGIRSLEDGMATFVDLQAGRGLKYVFVP